MNFITLAICMILSFVIGYITRTIILKMRYDTSWEAFFNKNKRK